MKFQSTIFRPSEAAEEKREIFEKLVFRVLRDCDFPADLEQIAAFVASRVRPACVVEPCSSDAYPSPATRPAYSVLDLTRAEAVIGPRPPWQDAVARVLSEPGCAG